MKYSVLTAISALALAAIMLIGCAQDDDDKQYYPGYISPGDFRLYGMLDDKQYNFSFLASGEGCGPTFPATDLYNKCLAVYTNWPATLGNDIYLPMEGVAISDRNRDNPVLEMKIYRLQGTDWKISMVYKGVEYTGAAPAGDITIAFTQTTIESIPSYVSYEGETLDGSGINLTRATVTFGAAITLTSTSGTTMAIQVGDSIVANANKVF